MTQQVIPVQIELPVAVVGPDDPLPVNHGGVLPRNIIGDAKDGSVFQIPEIYLTGSGIPEVLPDDMLSVNPGILLIESAGVDHLETVTHCVVGLQLPGSRRRCDRFGLIDNPRPVYHGLSVIGIRGLGNGKSGLGAVQVFGPYIPGSVRLAVFPDNIGTVRTGPFLIQIVVPHEDRRGWFLR